MKKREQVLNRLNAVMETRRLGQSGDLQEKPEKPDRKPDCGRKWELQDKQDPQDTGLSWWRYQLGTTINNNQEKHYNRTQDLRDSRSSGHETFRTQGVQDIGPSRYENLRKTRSSRHKTFRRNKTFKSHEKRDIQDKLNVQKTFMARNLQVTRPLGHKTFKTNKTSRARDFKDKRPSGQTKS